jgi:hypothetical protein
MLTASSGGGAQPHEMMDAILVKIAGDDGSNRRATLERSVGKEEGGSTMSEELEKERAHVRAAQWAFAHASMVVDCDEWEGDEAVDDDWEDDWGDEAPATRDPSTPDWRGELKFSCDRAYVPFLCQRRGSAEGRPGGGWLSSLQTMLPYNRAAYLQISLTRSSTRT